MIKAKAYAALAPGNELEPWEFERRDLQPNDVRIAISYCGICHTDYHQIRNDWFPGTFPMVPGHEIVGRVVDRGNNARKFEVGDIAAIGTMVDSCRVCTECLHHHEHMCLEGAVWTYNSKDKSGNPTYGGYSTTIVVHEDFALRVSKKLDPTAVGPLLCAGITTYSPLKKFNVGKGHKIAVAGLGGVGHLAVKFGIAFGADVTVLSTSASKEADARRLGAQHFVVTSDEGQVRQTQKTFDLIFDCIAANHDLNLYLGLLRNNGTLIRLGLPSEPFQISPFSLSGDKSITGSGSGGLLQTQEMLDFCAENGIVADVELINIKDINTAFERMLKGEVRYRFVIDMATL